MTNRTINTTQAQAPDITEFFSTTEYRVYDYILAGIITISMVTGLPGNLISLMYFLTRKKKDFSTLIYTWVCATDVCTFLIQLPVTTALFNNREPGIFDEKIFCIGWTVVFYYLQRMSMFLVMLLSVSRSIKMVFLQYKIRKRFLITSFIS